MSTTDFSSPSALIRELRKDAVFKPGDSLDTKPVKNVAVKVEPKQDDSDAYANKANDVVDSVMRRKPVSAPATPTGDSARFRLMKLATSPNGRYALGVGPDKKVINWKDYAVDPDDSEDFMVDTEQEKALNYLVDLNTNRILGLTGCQFVGTRQSYNHRENMVAWSPNSVLFLQATQWKWYSDACSVGMLQDDKLLGIADLLDVATKRAYAFLASHKNRAFKKHGNGFSIIVDDLQAMDDGRIEVGLSGEIPKSVEDDSEFEVTEHFRVKKSDKGISVVPIDVHYSSH